MKIRNLKTHWQLETGDWKLSQGFTLIELLVVIAIIGILAALSLVSFTAAQRQARDTQRKSDIKQYQTVLETFANKNATYPSRTTVTDVSTLCSTLGISGTCPTDPNSPDQVYDYISDGSGDPNTDAVNYVLWTTLQSQQGSFYVICSTGKVGIITSVPTSSTCPI